MQQAEKMRKGKRYRGRGRQGEGDEDGGKGSSTEGRQQREEGEIEGQDCCGVTFKLSNSFNSVTSFVQHEEEPLEVSSRLATEGDRIKY